MSMLKGKVAIVTGASSGIGRATAKLFAREGAMIVAGARRGPELDALVQEIGKAQGIAVALAGNVADESYAEALSALAVDRFGALHIAVNNAGTMGTQCATAEVPLKDWQQTIDVNLTGAFLCAKHQIPAMLKAGGGSIVFTSSFVGHTVGIPGFAAYAASKAGVIGLTRALAAELGPSGLRVNALLPGGTDTPMGRSFANTPETIAFVEGLHALKRRATPEEIAHSALYLASDASSFTTGSALLADGGVSINRT